MEHFLLLWVLIPRICNEGNFINFKTRESHLKNIYIYINTSKQFENIKNIFLIQLDCFICQYMLFESIVQEKNFRNTHCEE
jgi:hypothetical protein